MRSVEIHQRIKPDLGQRGFFVYFILYILFYFKQMSWVLLLHKAAPLTAAEAIDR